MVHKLFIIVHSTQFVTENSVSGASSTSFYSRFHSSFLVWKYMIIYVESCLSICLSIYLPMERDRQTERQTETDRQTDREIVYCYGRQYVQESALHTAAIFLSFHKMRAVHSHCLDMECDRAAKEGNDCCWEEGERDRGRPTDRDRYIYIYKEEEDAID